MQLHSTLEAQKKREPTTQDMELASGGIIPALIGLAIAVGSTVARTAVAQAFVGGMGIGWALDDVVQDLTP